MKNTIYHPYSFLGKNGLSTLFHIAFLSLGIIAIGLIVMIIEQRFVTWQSLSLYGVIILIGILFRISYRVVIQPNGTLIKLPFYRRYSISNLIGIVYGAVTNIGGVVYNVRCFFADGTHISLSIHDAKRFANELCDLNPSILCIDLQEK